MVLNRPKDRRYGLGGQDPGASTITSCQGQISDNVLERWLIENPADRTASYDGGETGSTCVEGRIAVPGIVPPLSGYLVVANDNYAGARLAA